MVLLTTGQVTLGKIASFLGIIQGVVWFIMSLMCIIEYSVETPPEYGNGSSYIDNFNTRVYYFYLYKDADLPSDTIVTPLAFLIFMCIFIVLNTAWVVASLFQINIVRKRSVNVPIVFKDWALITWLISLEDLVLVVLIGCDYNINCLDAYGEELCINTLIPVLVIAARGFILWFVNVTVAWMAFRSAKTLRQGGDYSRTFGGIIPIYASLGTIPRANVLPTPSLYSQQLGNVNDGKNRWNVNLRTAMENRTPPISPTSPYAKSQPQFFGRYQ